MKIVINFLHYNIFSITHFLIYLFYKHLWVCELEFDRFFFSMIKKIEYVFESNLEKFEIFNNRMYIFKFYY